nr:unnamed protein product [Callosobruchus analis]
MSKGHIQLMAELRSGDPDFYKNFLRMSATDFDHLLELISTKLRKKDTRMRKPITLDERLAVTLRYLATGDSYKSLMYLFRIPQTTIARNIPNAAMQFTTVCKLILFQTPGSQEQWEQVSNEYEKKWQYPHCLGALDGKHIIIKAPPKSGSHFFNYKGHHSVVLMALVDADYKFIYIDFGCNGRISDGGVFGNCTLSSALESNTLNIPEPRPLKGRKKLTPFVVVADDAFPLKPHLMKPFPFKQEDMQVATSVFNYRLSRARRVVENAFGLIAQRFHVWRRPVELSHPSRIISVVKAICVLHNYLLVDKDFMRLYAPPGYLDEVDGAQIIEGKWRSGGMPMDNFFPLNNDPSSRPTTNQTKDVRSEFTDYF